jgi:hypothetical protein
MTRANEYVIEISFKSDIKDILFSNSVPYYGSSSYTDNLIISVDKIRIEANRSDIIPLDSIFHNHFSSLYNQIIKALIFYYCSTRIYIEISSIEILRSRNGKILESKSLQHGEFNQVIDSAFTLTNEITHERLIALFLETPKGRSILFALSYLIRANSSIQESDKFEKLWKAFNKLFTVITGEVKDFNCLRKLREFVTNNPAILTYSGAKVSQLSTNDLRQIRWRSMILDFYDTEAKTVAFKDFILRYSDIRMMEIVRDTNFGYRRDFLQNKGLLVQVQTYIQDAIAANTSNNNEVVVFLTGKYMYFVRNKTFHGEKIDSSFRVLANKEDNELKFLNSVLEPYLIDLINANNLY